MREDSTLNERLTMAPQREKAASQTIVSGKGDKRVEALEDELKSLRRETTNAPPASEPGAGMLEAMQHGLEALKVQGAQTALHSTPSAQPRRPQLSWRATAGTAYFPTTPRNRQVMISLRSRLSDRIGRTRCKAIHTDMTGTNHQGSARGNTRHSAVRTIPVKKGPGQGVDERLPPSTGGRTTKPVSPSQAGVPGSGDNNLTGPLPTLLKGDFTTQ